MELLIKAASPEFYSDLTKMYLEQFLVGLITLFVFGSVILFIVDCVKAKKEQRKVKLWIKIMFIISLILIAVLIIGIFLIIFAIGVYIFGPR